MTQNREDIPEALPRLVPTAPEGSWAHAVQAAADAFDILSIAGERTIRGGDRLTNLQHHLSAQESRLNRKPAVRAGIDELHRLMRVRQLPFSVVLEGSIREMRVVDGITFDETAIQQTLSRVMEIVRQRRAERKTAVLEPGRSETTHGDRREERTSQAPVGICNVERRGGFFLPDVSVQHRCTCGEHVSVLGSHEIKAFADKASVDRTMRRIEVIWRLRRAKAFVECHTYPAETPMDYTKFLDSSKAISELKTLGQAALLSRIDNLDLPTGLSVHVLPAEHEDGLRRVDWNNVVMDEEIRSMIRRAIQAEDARLKARTGIAQEMCYLLAHAEICGGTHGLVTIGTKATTLFATGPNTIAVNLDRHEGVLDPAGMFEDAELFNRLPHSLIEAGYLNLRSLQCVMDQYAAMALAVGTEPTSRCPLKLPFRGVPERASGSVVIQQFEDDVSRAALVATARPELLSASSSLAGSADKRPPKRRRVLVDPPSGIRRSDDDDYTGAGGSSSGAQGFTALRQAGATGARAAGSALGTSSSSEAPQSVPSSRSRALTSGRPILLPPGDVDHEAAAQDGDDLVLGDDASGLALRPSDERLELLFGTQLGDEAEQVDENDREYALGDFLVWLLACHGVQIEVR